MLMGSEFQGKKLRPTYVTGQGPVKTGNGEFRVGGSINDDAFQDGSGGGGRGEASGGAAAALRRGPCIDMGQI